MKLIAAFLGALLLSSMPLGAAEFASPEGTWEIEMRDSRYAVELCGENGDALCGTLIWLGNGADTPENLPYLNTLLIDHAPKVSENQWKGTLHLFGQTATGTITQLSDNLISLEGCFLMVFCRTYQMYRFD
jgi:uncharacterized protein (DUF2147 family)